MFTYDRSKYHRSLQPISSVALLLINICTVSIASAQGSTVTLSSPTPTLQTTYAPGDSQTLIYTVTNYVPSPIQLPIDIGALNSPISRVQVANDCGRTFLPQAPRGSFATCNIGINIAPTNNDAGAVVSQRLILDYKGRTPLTSPIQFTVSTHLASLVPWTWESGSATGNAAGSYGTKGVPASTNSPPARADASGWRDSTNNFWLFGGILFSGQPLNDLWKYDGSNWTWVSGSSTANQSGTYGTLGVGDSNNIPGAREGASQWIDAQNTLWLFGGYGHNTTSSFGQLNDLWKYNGANWTWVGGSNTFNAVGVYGTQGQASISNIPGARVFSMSWTDVNGIFWLFGGQQTLNSSSLNDLWRYNPTNLEWTWISGSSSSGQAGTYGTQGSASSANTPGARAAGFTWIDTHGYLWLFGGFGSAEFTGGSLSDLWKFDGTDWIWISGSKTANTSGHYGSLGIPNANNIPGGRSNGASWIDASNNLWLFGGYGYDANGALGYLNDLWKFDGTEWTWMSGSTVINQPGVYGLLGVSSYQNTAGARQGVVNWVDTSGSFWLFGGYGYDSNGSFKALNDLWKL